MSETSYALAVERDLIRAGLTPAEREAFHAAAGKLEPEITDEEWALLLRYEGSSSWGRVA